MARSRIKGQEVSVLIVRGGVLEAELTDIQSFTFEPLFEVKDQGYLGEKTNLKDDIFNGCRFDMELHMHSDDWWRFLNAMRDRAQRRTPDLVFNISGVLSYPNGQTPTLTIPDAFFASSPTSIATRGDYVTVRLEGQASDYEVAFS